MIPTLQLLQILTIDQPSLPQVFKQPEIRSRSPQRLPAHRVFVRQMLHTHFPCLPPLITRHFPVAQRALGRQRWFLAAEVCVAVCFPLFFVLRDVVAVQKPEGAFVDGGAEVCGRYLQHAVVVFEERDARQLADEAGAYACFGGRGVGDIGDARAE